LVDNFRVDNLTVSARAAPDAANASILAAIQALGRQQTDSLSVLGSRISDLSSRVAVLQRNVADLERTSSTSRGRHPQSPAATAPSAVAPSTAAAARSSDGVSAALASTASAVANAGLTTATTVGAAGASGPPGPVALVATSRTSALMGASSHGGLSIEHRDGAQPAGFMTSMAGVLVVAYVRDIALGKISHPPGDQNKDRGNTAIECVARVISVVERAVLYAPDTSETALHGLVCMFRSRCAVP
jgi:hypothetical protein